MIEILRLPGWPSRSAFATKKANQRDIYAAAPLSKCAEIKVDCCHYCHLNEFKNIS
jgi:hypothetical protein